MHIHILGICGTFMAGIAAIAKQKGFHVTGSDQHVYPPMSDFLIEQGIIIKEGYLAEHLDPAPDLVVVGNAMKRGMPAVEYMLDHHLPYRSGPQWLAENILQDRWVLAVAGTHGKTTTSSMLAHILEEAGLHPGFLIGGIPLNFNVAARLGNAPFFVIEADEYDSAFFDKRSKFVHYQARTAILNNLEFDHADIFSDLAAIQTQFHHLVRTIPSSGAIIMPQQDAALEQVIEQGCWTPRVTVGLQQGDWSAGEMKGDGSEFTVYHQQTPVGRVAWSVIGIHNVQNALAAMAAAHHAGVAPEMSVQALQSFKNVKRRMEVRAMINDITIYDDFAHHPTAIESTLTSLRHRVGKQRIIAVLEMGSYTMKTGNHGEKVPPALAQANQVFIKQPNDYDARALIPLFSQTATVTEDIDQLVAQVSTAAKPGDHILIMSNRGFGGFHQKLINAMG